MAVLSGRGSYQMYELIEDHDQGFNDAVVNNQQNLAMHYLVEIIADLKNRISELENEKSDAAPKRTAPTTPVKKAPAAKKTTKKAASKKEDDDAVEESDES